MKAVRFDELDARRVVEYSKTLLSTIGATATNVAGSQRRQHGFIPARSAAR
ncbi:MAG: hypothetical protein ACHP8B_03100 [Terriglobales bacterium]